MSILLRRLSSVSAPQVCKSGGLLGVRESLGCRGASFLSVARRAAAPASSVLPNGAPVYREVPFVHEDMESVMKEVPDFKYYYIGNSSPSANKYKDISLDQPVLHPSDFPAYTPASGEIEYSRLPNGMRIASVDRGAMTSSLGLFVKAGSRDEDASNFGVSHMLQSLAFSSTAHLSMLRTVKSIEVMGATAGCTAGREHIVYSAECLRTHMPLLVPLLVGNILFPRLLPWELHAHEQKVLTAKQKLERMPDQMVSELLHTTAWHSNTLGNRLYATEQHMSHYNADTMRNFILNNGSPDNMVFVGVNVEHNELSKWLMRSFVDYNAAPPTPKKNLAPVYTGGDVRMEMPSPHTHIAIAYETTGGWNSSSLVALSLLQVILGGGGAFSTGGPGKGMYSRVYTQLLNRHEWIESAMAFNTQYSDAGLFGIYMLAQPNKAASAVQALAEQIAKMNTVTSEELMRAKNSLKSSIYMNLECRGIVMEDIGRQLLMSGKVISPSAFCASIDAVTTSDIRKVVDEMLRKVPTVVAYGDVAGVPHYEEIKATLNAARAGK